MAAIDDRAGDDVIEVRGLTLSFGDKLVHRDLNFSVRRGEILAIVGASGCGKSTLLRELTLLQQPDSGTVRLLGEDTATMSPQRILELRRRIGVLFQNGALFGNMTALQNIGAPLREHTDLGRALIDEIACVKLGLVGLTPEDGLLYPNQLSGGMHKRVALARAIALDPGLLFLDEPTSGLDPLSADAFDALVVELKAALDPTIVLVTHDMDSLWQVADRVILMGEARLLAVGTMQEMAASADPAVQHFFRTARGRAAEACR
ncbi:MAG TPA: ATP-binding cassette domain-containing protein [Gammaproteobacteria bacterium]|nr:ATP-binding cassette domain-containing protein [Gammaproteobacteria bacterium]